MSECTDRDEDSVDGLGALPQYLQPDCPLLRVEDFRV